MPDAELKALAALTILFFVSSSLWPFGYAAPATPPAAQPAAKQVSQNMGAGLHSVLPPATSSGKTASTQPAVMKLASENPPVELTAKKSASAACAKQVQTEELTWSEYYSLLAAGANGSIDAFGDLAAQERQKNYDRADLAEEGAVNNVKDQFIITNQGRTVMLFDALKHRFVSPDEAGCYLSRVVANGRMSYTTEVDLNTRICSEHYATGAGKQCAYGHLSEPNRKSMEAVSKQHKKLLEAYNELLKDSPDYSKVKAAMDEACTNLFGLLCTDYSSQIARKNRTELQRLVLQAAGTSNLTQFGENPVNIVTSNKTAAQLEQAQDGQVWMFPVWLVFLLQYIQAQEGIENWYFVASWGPMVISLASLKAPGMVAGKAAVAAKTVEKAFEYGEKVTSKLGKLKGGLKGISNPEKIAEDIGRISDDVLDDPTKIASLAKKWQVPEEDVVEIFTKMKSGKLEDVKEAFKMKAGGIKHDDAMKTLFEKHRAAYNSEVHGGYDILKADDWADPQKVNEMQRFLGWIERGPDAESVKLAKILSGQFQGLAPTDTAAFRTALFGRTGGVAGADILDDIVKDAYFRIPGTTKKISEWAEASTKAGRWGKVGYTLATWIAKRGLGILRGAERNIFLARAAMLVDFGFTTFLQQRPVPVYVTRGMRFELQPQSRIVGDEPSYLEIGKLSATVSPDTMPRDFFSALFKFMNVDLKAVFGAEMNPANFKMQNIGNYVALVDQETPAAAYAKKPRNFINPVKGKWSFLGLNPDATDLYKFEHPNAYYQTGGNKYTAMALVSRNLNISNVVIESDLATFGAAASLHAIIPSADWWAAFTLIGGGIDFVGGFPARSLALRRGIGALFTWQFMRTLSGETVNELGRTGQELRIGGAVNLAEAFRSGKLCKDVEKRMEEKIGGAGNYMLLSLGVNYLTSGFVTAAPFIVAAFPGAGALTVAGIYVGVFIADIAVGWWNVKATEEYQEAKFKALDEMKECAETEFKIFAWGKIPTDEGEKDLLSQSLKEIGKGVAGTLGPVLNAISPETKQALDQVAANTYHNTLMVRSAVSGESLINFFGTKVYQVHFDPETDISWMLGSAVTADGKACPLNLCYEQADGSFKCLTAQGYELRDVNGKLILDSPLVLGAHWNNLEQYFGIPQKVINVNNEGALGNDVLLEFDTSKDVVDRCTREEVKALAKTTKFETVFGDFIGAYTDRAMVWKDGNAVSVRFTEEAEAYGEAQIVTIEDAKITVYKSGKIKIAGKDTTIELNMRPASDDYMLFSNAKITPGKTAPYLNTLHIMTRVLLTFNIKQAEDYDLKGACTDPETGKKIIGMKFGLDLTNPADEARANEILQDICFTDIRGLNEEHISIKDGQMCVTDINNKTTCYDITGYDEDTGSFILKDPETGKEFKITLERGPNGEPQFIIRDADGNPVGAPIPLLWATGMGGAMMYDPKTGQISIKNEFPFAINPNFGIYGAGGTGLMFPQPPLTGGKPRVPETKPLGAPSPLAALPGVPTESLQAALFAAVLLAGLLLVRAKYSKPKNKKRSTP